MCAHQVEDYPTWLYPTFSIKASTLQVSHDNKWVPGRGQGYRSYRCYPGSGRKTCYSISQKSALYRILQSPLSCPKTREQVATCDRSEPSEHVLGCSKVQDGNTRIHSVLSLPRRVGNLDRPPRCVLSRTHPSPALQISQICPPRQSLPVCRSPIRASDGPVSIHPPSKRGETNGPEQRHQGTYVLGRLADQGTISRAVETPHSRNGVVGRKPGMAHKPVKVRAGPDTAIRVRGVQVQLIRGSCPTHSRQVEQVVLDGSGTKSETCHLCKRVDVLNWLAGINREDGTMGQVAHASFAMAPQTELAVPSVPRNQDSMGRFDKISTPVVVRPKQCVKRVSFAPQRSRSLDVYRRIKRRLGWTIRRLVRKRSVVPIRKGSPHKPAGVESGSARSQSVQEPVHRPGSVGGDRQHVSSGLCEQTGRHSISSDVCSSVEIDVLVQPQPGFTTSQTRTRSPKRTGGRSLQVQSNPVDRVVTPPGRGDQPMQTLVHPKSGPLCNQTQPQISSVCVSGSRPESLGSRCPPSRLVGSNSVCLPTDSSNPSGGIEAVSVSVSTGAHSPRLARNVVVLGSGSSVPGDSSPSTSLPMVAQTTHLTSVP